MKTITRVLILLLALCMVLPFMASCNDKNNNNNNNKQTTPSGQTPDTPTGPVDPDANIIMPEVIDMGGYTYKAYVRKYAGETPDAHKAQIANGNNRYECIDFWVDESTIDQDAISYAVFTRNNKIESTYNCKIRQVPSDSSQLEHLTVSYSNGDGYDLTIMTAKPAAQAASLNLLRNLNDMPYVDLHHNSFDQNSVNELSVADKLYFVSGDMNVSTMEVAGLSIVNMSKYADLVDEITKQFNDDPIYADIYTLVKSKKWTMDTMLKIATIANIDMDTSDGPLNPLTKGDTLGYYQYYNSTLWYFYGSGGRITNKTEEGLPEFVIGKETNQNLVNYIYENFNHAVNVSWMSFDASATLNANFLSGEVLFMDCSLFEVRTDIYNNATFEYGILPCPLYQEGQDYHSVVYFNNWAHLWAIPSMVNDPEMAERMLQVMTVYSSLSDSTMYAYYDRTIYLQASPDNGSREVMDTIRKSLVYDIALLFTWGGSNTGIASCAFEAMLNNLASSKTNEYASNIQLLPYIQQEMEYSIETLRNPSMS